MIISILCSPALFMCSKPSHQGPEPGITTACYAFNSPRPWRYCETSSDGGDPHYLLYYFHGRGGNEHTWADSCRAIRDSWRRSGAKAPTVISVSFGERWLLAPRNNSTESGLLEFFLNTVMPAVENNRACAVKKRSIMGASMGGFSAAQLLFRRPELFSKGVLVHPAITPVSPYADETEIDSFAALTREQNRSIKSVIRSILFMKDPTRDNIEEIFATSRIYFPDRASWEEASPLRLVTTPQGPVMPELYISCGDRDEHGLFLGSEKLVSLARENDLKVRWQPLNGGHGMIDYSAVAGFLAE